MEISRILRVLITLLLLVSFIAMTVAAYRQNREINKMTTLSDATSSIMTSLATQEMVWVDGNGDTHPYILDSEKLKNLNYSKVLGGENFAFQATITYLQDNNVEEIGPYGENPPENRLICSLSASVTLYEGRKPVKLKVVSWYA